MKIDDNLNMVLPVREDELYVYHTPISKEVFEINYKALAAVKGELASKGTAYQMLSGPSIAALAFKDEVRKSFADQMDASGADRVIGAFFAELRRLSMVLVAGANGYDMKPVDAAIKSGALDEEDWEEVESSLVFFTCHYWLTKRAQRASLANATASLLQGFVTSSSVSELGASLPKLTNAEASEKPGKAASSVPV